MTQLRHSPEDKWLERLHPGFYLSARLSSSWQEPPWAARSFWAVHHPLNSSPMELLVQEVEGPDSFSAPCLHPRAVMRPMDSCPAQPLCWGMCSSSWCTVIWCSCRQSCCPTEVRSCSRCLALASSVAYSCRSSARSLMLRSFLVSHMTINYIA